MSPLSLSPVGTELLDDPSADARTVEESLRNLTRANRWFGGAAAVTFGLGRLLAGEPRGSTFSLLDIGTGSADLPRAAVRWAEARGWRLEPLGLERSRVAARRAALSLPAAVGCAGALPIRDKSVDLVLVSQVAHHLAPESAIELFRACDRLARRGVVVADLRRSTIAWLGYGVGARLLGFDKVTVADGLTSIRRGYRRPELAALLDAAGVRGTVVRRLGFRLVATWQPRWEPSGRDPS
jgi:SAM-dependent methyltransferase